MSDTDELPDRPIKGCKRSRLTAMAPSGNEQVSPHDEHASHRCSNNNNNNSIGCTGRRCLQILVSRSEAMLEASCNIDKSISDEIPIMFGNRDMFQMWQEKQMLKGNLDNIINNAIEQYMPLHSESEEEDDVQAENEGISMAIQSHGLTRRDEPFESGANAFPAAVPSADDTDFLNTAISCAIQKKGLY